MEVIVNQLAVFVFNNLVATNCSYRIDIILPQINFLVFLSLSPHLLFAALDVVCIENFSH
jgi:hypothetical protein